MEIQKVLETTIYLKCTIFRNNNTITYTKQQYNNKKRKRDLKNKTSFNFFLYFFFSLWTVREDIP